MTNTITAPEQIGTYETAEIETPLQRALLETRTPILNEDRRQAYMASKLAQEQWRFRWAKFRAAILFLSIACAFSTCFSLLAMRGYVVYAAPFLILAVGTLVFFVAVLSAPMIVSWQSYVIATCNDGALSHQLGFAFTAEGERRRTVVPDELVERVRKIYRVVDPAAYISFGVEQLNDDPFLLVSDAESVYAIGVWDERGFIA